MFDLLQHHSLNFFATTAAVYAVYVLATHQAEKPIAGIRRRRSGILALLGANAIWIYSGLMLTEAFAIVSVNLLFIATYYRNYLVRQRLRREFETRKLARMSNGMDVLC